MNCFNLTLAVFFAFFISSPYSDTHQYILTPQSSTVYWESLPEEGNHHHGTMRFKSGAITLAGDSVIQSTFILNTQSIVCEDIADEGYNQEHVIELKSEEILNSAAFPTLSLRSQHYSLTGQIENHYNYNINTTAQIKEYSVPLTHAATLTKQENSIIYACEVTLPKEETNLPFAIKLNIQAHFEKQAK